MDVGAMVCKHLLGKSEMFRGKVALLVDNAYMIVVHLNE
jgi:hypothetical protein